MPATPDLANVKTILAFDFGLRRIGVAVGQSVTQSASPLGVVANRNDGVDFSAIDTFIREWRPQQLVVGLPMHADGRPSEMQIPVAAFIEDLGRFELPIASVDERYTSIEAEATLKAARAEGRRGRLSKEMVDSAAAVFIAERYLASA